MAITVPQLGKLEKVSLREGWSHEALSFTPWLAQEENLRSLAETIGLDLVLEGTEKDVGPFRADIICRDLQEDDHIILIENQLERTDHSHLGQIITYAAGLSATSVVWIASEFTEEHRAALDWLNEVTSSRLNFFGIQVELWRIGSSPPAPRFHIVSKPNDWSKAIRITNAGLSEIGKRRKEYWSGFRDYLDRQGGRFSFHGDMASGHIAFRSPFPGVAFVVYVNLPKQGRGGHGLFLRLTSDENFELRNYLRERKEEIEKNMGFRISWGSEVPAQNYHLAYGIPADTQDPAKWPEQYRWYLEHLEKLETAFMPNLREFFSGNS
jgi:hypothetical protein